MKRDKFEELLHDKLARTEVPPPSDMWARLESQLPEIRRELAFGDALPAPKIRRPLRQKMRWAYAVASVAVVAMMVLTLRNLEEAAVVAGGGEDTKGQKIVPVTEPVTPDAIPAVLPSTATYANAGTARMQTVAQNSGDNGYVPTDDNTITATPETNRTDIPAADTEPNTPGPSARPAQDKTSDTKRQEEFAAFMARAIADDGKRERRTGPVTAASLFAVNGTGLTGSGTVTGRVKLYKSPLTVIETTESPGEETAGGTRVTASDLSLKHDLPLGFGASVNFGLTRNLSVETGFTYTYMRSKGESKYTGVNTVNTQKLHYLGIPVKLKYDFFQSRFVDLYAGAGVSVEKLLSGKITSTDYYDDGRKNTVGTDKFKVGSLQTSVGANVGVEFNIDRTFGIYVEPGVGYFFENGNQPDSYRTENPFNFTVKAGFRIKL